MKKHLIIFFFALVLIQCTEEITQPVCSTPATVKDLTGLDGCGFVFELQDGTRLQPVRNLICGTPPLPKEITEDPLFNFQVVHGKKVLIDYEIVDGVNICMAGPMVKITCIQEVILQSGTDDH